MHAITDNALAPHEHARVKMTPITDFHIVSEDTSCLQCDEVSYRDIAADHAPFANNASNSHADISAYRGINVN